MNTIQKNREKHMTGYKNKDTLPYSSFYIISAFKAMNKTDKNLRQSRLLKTNLRLLNATFEQVEGQYQGEGELAFIVDSKTILLSAIIDLLNLFNQDCALMTSTTYEDGNEVALLYPNQTFTGVGKFTMVGRQEPEGDYTFVPSSGLYYQIKPVERRG